MALMLIGQEYYDVHTLTEGVLQAAKLQMMATTPFSLQPHWKSFLTALLMKSPLKGFEVGFVCVHVCV